MNSFILQTISLTITITLASTLDTLPSTSPGTHGFEAFCETETFQGSCGADEVILITHARYGRMRISRCVKLDYGHVGCVSDVTEFADYRCSGKRRCEIRIPDVELTRYKPCPEDLKPYMEIGHRCVHVETSKDFCIYPRSTPVRSPLRGYLASLVTEMTGCGGVSTPWVIQVPIGQTIRLILLDFGVLRFKNITSVTGSASSQHLPLSSRIVPGSRPNTDSAGAMPHTTRSFSDPDCQTYAVVREIIYKYNTGSDVTGDSRNNAEPPGAGTKTGHVSLGVQRTYQRTQNVTVCGGSARQSVVYDSSTSRLEVGLVRQDHLMYGPHFIIEYKAVGCPDLDSIPNSWFSRKSDQLTIHCNHSNQVYQLTCSDNNWTGEKGNCSSAPLKQNMEKLSNSGLSVPYGVSMVIILIIALAIGTFVLSAGLMFLKKRGGIHACSSGGVTLTTSPSDAKQQQQQYHMAVRSLDGTTAIPCDKLPSWAQVPTDSPERIYGGVGAYGMLPYQTSGISQRSPLLTGTKTGNSGINYDTPSAIYCQNIAARRKATLPCGCETFLEQTPTSDMMLDRCTDCCPLMDNSIPTSMMTSHYDVNSSTIPSCESNMADSSAVYFVLQNKGGIRDKPESNHAVSSFCTMSNGRRNSTGDKQRRFSDNRTLPATSRSRSGSSSQAIEPEIVSDCKSQSENEQQLASSRERNKNSNSFIPEANNYKIGYGMANNGTSKTFT